MISDIPFPMPVGAVRIGQDEEGNFIVNPEEETLLDPKLDLVVAGTEEAILMVEAGAKEVTEQEILDALDIAHGEIKKLCEAQRELQKKAGKTKVEVEVPQVDESLLGQVQDKFGVGPRRGHPGRGQARAPGRHQARRGGGAGGVRRRCGPPEYAEKRAAAQLAFDKLEKNLIRQRIAVDKKRPDGRSAEEIRADLDRGRRHPAHARLRAVHARPDAGAVDGGTRHHARGDAARHARARRRRSSTSTTTTSRRSRWGRPAA